ncbi:MAG TPA: polysaccharide biosynthesis C-terminal domain-containing protein [Mycobacteriales bacterium]|nr:polysaccharide biosynthesis C-terminal domain-containing protein [Mycobacteriales bacterium]
MGASAMVETAGPRTRTSRPRVDPQSQVRSGALWTGLTWVLTVAGGPIITVVLVRSMSQSEFGNYAFVRSAVGLVAIASAFGLEATVARFAAIDLESGRGDSLPSYRSGLIIARYAAVCGAVLVALIAAAMHLTARGGVGAGVLLLSVPVAVCAPYAAVYGGSLRAVHRPVVSSVATLTSAAVFAGIVVTLLLAHATVTATQAVVALSVESLVLLAVRRCGVPRNAVGGGVGRSWRLPLAAREMVPFAAAVLLTGLFATAVSELDVVVLGIDRGVDAVASYAPLSMVANGVLGMPAIVGSFYVPAAARVAVRRDPQATARLYHLASRWSMVLCAPAIAVMLLCPHAALTVLFSAASSSQAAWLRVLGVGVAAQVGFGFNGLTLDAQGLAGVVARRQAVCLAVSLLSCALLVPSLGAMGAALATSIALVLANLMCSWSLVRRFGIWPWDWALARTSGGAVLGAVIGLAWSPGTPGSALVDCVAVAVGCLLGGLAGATTHRGVAAGLDALGLRR